MRILIAVFVLIAVPAAVASAADPKPAPLVVVTMHGGLCVSGRECRSVYRITETAVLDQSGKKLHAISRAQRRRLERAIGRIDLAEVRKHPFTGTCPTAYDGSEMIFAFRGVRAKLASCRYDLSRVEAARLATRLVHAGP
jgi:hypothetical protein